MASGEGRSPFPVVSAQRVREAAGRVTVHVPDHEHGDQPVIELVREGDVVRAIDITCACGRRLRVLCDYLGKADS